jgi:hypothetical protein
MRTRAPRAAQISFALPAGALLSALKIDQLNLSGETYKPYKGVGVRWGASSGGSSGKENKLMGVSKMKERGPERAWKTR